MSDFITYFIDDLGWYVIPQHLARTLKPVTRKDGWFDNRYELGRQANAYFKACEAERMRLFRSGDEHDAWEPPSFEAWVKEHLT